MLETLTDTHLLRRRLVLRSSDRSTIGTLYLCENKSEGAYHTQPELPKRRDYGDSRVESPGDLLHNTLRKRERGQRLAGKWLECSDASDVAGQS